MSKYTFERLGARGFEELVQTLLEKLYRVDGKLIQFGEGADGAREAVWIQGVGHHDCPRPQGETTDISKKWVFQAKYHDIGLRGWGGARKDVVSDLSTELDKVVNKYHLGCHHYVLITNVPFSGVRYVGTRDEVEAVVNEWTEHIPEIEVWDATDLSRMLDADPGTRTTYLDAILPGDVLQSIIQNVSETQDRRSAAFRAYLRAILRFERDAKAEEAGDERGLALEKAFVDLDLKLISRNHDNQGEIENWLGNIRRAFEKKNEAKETDGFYPSETRVPAILTLLKAPSKSMLLKGGPGVGKSTITQFITLYHASRMVDQVLAKALAKRLKLWGVSSAEEVDNSCRLRFPLRIELRRYAVWIRRQQDGQNDTFLALYIAYIINQAASASLTSEDIFDLAKNNAVLLILDGLDEVADPGLRELIFRELATFHDRCAEPGVDLQTILSTRPQGYRGEFDGFYPLSWQILDLSRSDFDDYSERWIADRIANPDEQRDAAERVREGMRSPAVCQLAGTLLQATVMLTIVQKKQPIPHARHKLFQKYVEVIFNREKTKETVYNHCDVLLHLHNLVGYELIRRMGSPTESPTLCRDDFSKCVQRVFEEYGAEELRGKSVKEMREEITTLAKDRLCLIAGKGDEQEEIDFVIQPFREYFAASYLAHHEEADVEKVYDSLVERGHIWLNVLKFYAAFQTPAQQKNWITDAESTEHSDVVRLVRRRRTLLGLLPEFQRPKLTYIDRAFRAIFFSDTLWSWGGAQDIAPLLLAFAGNSAFRRLCDVFTSSANIAATELEIQLKLLEQLASEDKDTGSEEELNEIIERERLNKEVRSTVRRIIIQHDFPLRWWKYSPTEDRGIGTIWDCFFSRERPRPLTRFVNILQENELLDIVVLMYTGFSRMETETFGNTWVGQLISHLNPDGISNFDNPISFSLEPFAVDRKATDTSEWIQKLESSKAVVAPYLVALLHAISNPLTFEFHQKALEEYAKLQKVIPSFGDHMSTPYRIDAQLGPSYLEFESIDKWANSRQALFRNSDRLFRAYRETVTDNPKNIIVLSTSPVLWSKICAEIGLEVPNIFDDELRTLVDTFFQVDSQPVSISHWSHTWGRSKFSIVVFRFLEMLVDEANAHGTKVFNNWLWHFLRFDFLPKIDETNTADRLLRKSLELPGTTPLSLFVIVFCATNPDVNITLLLQLWEKNESAHISRIAMSQISVEVIEAVLTVKSDVAVRLAAFLMATITRNQTDRNIFEAPKHTEQLFVRVHAALCDSLSRSTSMKKSLAATLLLNLPAHEQELKMWAQQSFLEAIDFDGIFGVDLEHRFDTLVRNRGVVVSEEIRSGLRVFVDRRSDFPIQLSLAALEATLVLDELVSSGVSDKDWQK